MPAKAEESCPLYVLPDGPATMGDLKEGYATRGKQLVECDSLRALAVTAFHVQLKILAQHEQNRADRNCPAWKFWGCKAPK